MSEPAPPDGTDPRILAPDDDEDSVIIAHGYSTGKTFHTTECPTVKRMERQNHVPKSVATWKDYTKCKRCDTREGGDGYDHPGRGPRDGPSRGQLVSGVNRYICLQIRTLLFSGASQADVADRLSIGSATVGRHARGECGCEHNGRTLTYTHGEYKCIEDEGVPQHITGYAPIDMDTCRTMRRTIPREGVDANPFATVLGVSHSALRRHARGECDHGDHTPTATFDLDTRTWRADE